MRLSLNCPRSANRSMSFFLGILNQRLYSRDVERNVRPHRVTNNKSISLYFNTFLI